MIIEVYPNHLKFTRNDLSYQVNGSLSSVLDSVNKQRLSVENVALFDEADFVNGNVNLDIHDYRVTLRSDIGPEENPSSSSQAQPQQLPGVTGSTSVGSPSGSGIGSSGSNDMLNVAGPSVKPSVTSLTLVPDMRTMWEGIVKSLDPSKPVTEDMLLDIESKLLVATEPDLCLDPSPKVAQVSSQIAYNQSKYRVKLKRSRHQMEREEEAAEMKQNLKLMLLDEKRDFHPTFSRLQFIEEYRKKRKIADAEVVLGLEFKKAKQRKGAANNAAQLQNLAKVTRTIRYEKAYSRGTLYTLLNIIETGPDEYEALLRYGDVEGTALGPYGGSHRFPVGNAAAVDYYIGHFKNFYSLTNDLKQQYALPGGTTITQTQPVT
ncbi:Transcription factor spt20 [Blyttiomyces sp. JEL0837]|nr:Transcription factor spt20 [Blyttiomyces sp. JEL0837]